VWTLFAGSQIWSGWWKWIYQK